MPRDLVLGALVVLLQPAFSKGTFALIGWEA